MTRNGIGLVGCGAIGGALVRGITRQGGMDPAAVLVYDTNEGRMMKVAGELGVKPVAGLSDLIPHCRHILIAVKPQDVESLLTELNGLIRNDQMVTSVAAGVSTRYIESCLPRGCKVIRLMPNTPCLLGEGAIAMSAGEAVSEQERDEVENLLKPLGLTIRVPEKLMDAVTGLSGTGPAYVFLFMETLIDAGVAVGLNRDVATPLVVQTVIGAARMLQQNAKHPAELRNAVTSPAGTTSAALQVLEEEGFRSSMIKAVIEATRRAGEMERANGSGRIL